MRHVFFSIFLLLTLGSSGLFAAGKEDGNILLSYDFTYEGQELSVYIIVPKFFGRREFEDFGPIQSLLRINAVTILNPGKKIDDLLDQTEKWVVNFYDQKGLFRNGAAAMRESLLVHESVKTGRSSLVMITGRGNPSDIKSILRVDTLTPGQPDYGFEKRLLHRGLAERVPRPAIDYIEDDTAQIDFVRPHLKTVDDKTKFFLERSFPPDHEDREEAKHKGYVYTGLKKYRGAGAELKSVINNSPHGIDTFGLAYLLAEAHGLTRYSGRIVPKPAPPSPGPIRETGVHLSEYWIECDVSKTDLAAGALNLVDYYRDKWGFEVVGKPMQNPDIPENMTFIMKASRKSFKEHAEDFFLRRVKTDPPVEFRWLPRLLSPERCELLLRRVRTRLGGARSHAGVRPPPRPPSKTDE